MANPDCAFCDRPDPRDPRRIPVITCDGGLLVCGLCAIQLLTSRQVTLMLEPAPARVA
jgi:hypothetical protein